MQSRIFQLFTQIEDHSVHAKGGLGIGLALARQLVEMHGGTIEAHSGGIGQGSTFTLRVPLAQAVGGEAMAEDAPQAAANRPLKVLVVDDNAMIAMSMGWMLEEMGHDFQVVNDGREALEAARDYRPDAILLDIGLPVMDGYEVCRAFRQDDDFRQTLIVAQTGWGQDRDKELAAQAGFDHHLVKPVAYEALEQLLLAHGMPGQQAPASETPS
jgi:CheY-like chemotaxis protein